MFRLSRNFSSQNLQSESSETGAGDHHPHINCTCALPSKSRRRKRHGRNHVLSTPSALTFIVTAVAALSLLSSPNSVDSFSARFSPLGISLLKDGGAAQEGIDGLRVVSRRDASMRRRGKRNVAKSKQSSLEEHSPENQEGEMEDEKDENTENETNTYAPSGQSKYVVGTSTALSATAVPGLSDSFLGDDEDGDDQEEKVEPTVMSCLRPLLKMTRPSNFPGVILFHILGVHRALSTGLASSSIPLSYSPSLLLRTLRQPQMIIVTIALLLTSATSMLINDFYDARSGVDARNLLTQALQKSSHSSTSGDNNTTYSHLEKPLATGAVPMIVAKRFLSYLYAALLICLTAVPGVASRLTVVIAAMLTFWYTQHLKPRTWLKNVTCAALIALSPFTSGSAALHLVLEGGGNAMRVGSSIFPALLSMWRLVLTLFAGFMSREIIMDVCDYEGDMEAGVRTVPVKYGKRFATRVAFAFAAILGVLAAGVPGLGFVGAWDVAQTATATTGEAVRLILRTPIARKFGLAVIGSGMILRRAIQVAMTEGEDLETAARAVDEQKEISVLFILASFI